MSGEQGELSLRLRPQWVRGAHLATPQTSDLRPQTSDLRLQTSDLRLGPDEGVQHVSTMAHAQGQRNKLCVVLQRKDDALRWSMRHLHHTPEGHHHTPEDQRSGYRRYILVPRGEGVGAGTLSPQATRQQRREGTHKSQLSLTLSPGTTSHEHVSANRSQSCTCWKVDAGTKEPGIRIASKIRRSVIRQS